MKHGIYSRIIRRLFLFKRSGGKQTISLEKYSLHLSDGRYSNKIEMTKIQ